MKGASKKTTKKELSAKEIENIFKEIRPAEKVFTPMPAPETGNNISDRWIVTGGSSKPNNKLIEVSTWQTGQVS